MYYAVCYGHALRYEKASRPTEAAKLAFGMVDDRRMTVRELPKNPRSMAKAAEREFIKQLAIRHFQKTGKTLSGQAEVPGIKNVHWTECQLCRKPILTEPAASGVDEALCTECEPKYSNLTEQEKEELSISAMREKLDISVR